MSILNLYFLKCFVLSTQVHYRAQIPIFLLKNKITGDIAPRLTLYKKGTCSINLKSGTSPRFEVFRGVNHGCPVSPYLFVIASQLLTSYLLNSSLQGINHGIHDYI